MTVSKQLQHDLIEVLYRHFGPRAVSDGDRDDLIGRMEDLVVSYVSLPPVMQGCPLRGKAPCNRHRQTNKEAS